MIEGQDLINLSRSSFFQFGLSAFNELLLPFRLAKVDLPPHEGKYVMELVQGDGIGLEAGRPSVGRRRVGVQVVLRGACIKRRS